MVEGQVDKTNKIDKNLNRGNENKLFFKKYDFQG